MIVTGAKAGAVLGAGLVLLTGCASVGFPDGSASEMEAARAAVVAYVEAIESLDLETATAMTSPDALDTKREQAGDDAIDITAALPGAEPIRDPWVTFQTEDFTYLDDNGDGTIGPGESRTADTMRFLVSFEVGDGTGADDVQVTLTGEDSSDPESWTITDPLLSARIAFVDLDTVP
ncbi:MAG: hypothetical protein ACTH31_07735, partial [Pseudoclavibacter sp.]